jgi:hypothetical protein
VPVKPVIRFPEKLPVEPRFVDALFVRSDQNDGAATGIEGKRRPPDLRCTMRGEARSFMLGCRGFASVAT